MNLQIMEVLKYLIPHEGMITIVESGSIEIVNIKSISGSPGRTIIPASEGVKHDFREIINSPHLPDGQSCEKRFSREKNHIF